MKTIKLIIIALGIVIYSQSQGSRLETKLYINSDSFETVDDVKFPYKAFNSTPVFSSQNVQLEFNVGDTLNLWVVNNDSLTHQFDIKGLPGFQRTISKGDSILLEIAINKAGVYVYFDPLNFPNNVYLGLAGMIIAKDHNLSSFYWNLKEHLPEINSSLVKGTLVDWSLYEPTYFTINGRSHPESAQDERAVIKGFVGDSIILNITNTGKSIHPIHFHGYHAEILYSSKYPSHVGRNKDTHVIHPMECLVLLIVPDKPGIYPVHNHNLVAVTAAGVYPNGMFTTLQISKR